MNASEREALIASEAKVIELEAKLTKIRERISLDLDGAEHNKFWAFITLRELLKIASEP